MKKDCYIACPFCGRRKAEVKHSQRWGYFVSCACTAVGPGRATRIGAIEAWNHRSNPEQESLFEGLQSKFDEREWLREEVIERIGWTGCE